MLGRIRINSAGALVHESASENPRIGTDVRSSLSQTVHILSNWPLWYSHNMSYMHSRANIKYGEIYTGLRKNIAHRSLTGGW